MNEGRQNTNNGLEATTVTTVEGVEEIRGIWEQIQSICPVPVVNADIDRYLSINGAIGCGVKPYVILLKRYGHPEAILIGRIRKRALELKFGYKVLMKPELRFLTIINGGLIGDIQQDSYDFLYAELRKSLRSGEADVLFFNHILKDSPLYQLSQSIPSFLCRGHFPHDEIHRRTTLPDSLESFYMARSKKHRGNLRRCIKKMETEHPDHKIVTYRSENELDEAITSAALVSKETYQHAFGRGFVDDDSTRNMLSVAARHGWLWLSVLYINQQPCGFQYILKYGNMCSLEYIGFDPAWKASNIGTVLFIKDFELMCKDPEVEFLDYGFGDADYKGSYGDIQFQEANMYVFAPRFYPIFINAIRTILIGVTKGVRSVLERGGFMRRVKRNWRNYLQSSNKN